MTSVAMGDGAERPLKAIAKRSVEKPLEGYIYAFILYSGSNVTFGSTSN
ncbi:hypothetical protein PN483_10480 [Nodularia spumigena CS-591/04]|nr:hypothetical protein [Nodularia spumigena]MDB9322354.1 hypothetical protein [Nodularia spumigena CS-591/07A]MDB9330914.1 hypothetical protein [Nodularia spumigena CS-591/04]MDB9360219.1 hypothetical protein [Nodularia spumigena CS-588/02]